MVAVAGKILLVLDAELHAALDKALVALRDLYDEQNGPPQIRREKQWKTAYDKAGEVLEENGA